MSHKLDSKDQKILDVLKEHSDYATRDIAKKTLLPATTIHNRIKKMKEQGIIKRFTIELDNAKTGKGFVAYVLVSVDLKILKEKGKTQHNLINEISKFYFVERADIVSGGADVVVVVRVKDVEEFDKVLLEKLQLVEGIERTQSLIVIHGKQ